MKKLNGILVLALFLLSIISVTADLEIPEDVEEEIVEDLNDKYFCDELEYLKIVEDFNASLLEDEEVPDEEDEEELVKPTCKERPVVAKKSGGGGFYIAKGKTLFGMTSKYDGRGFGIMVNKVDTNKKVTLYLPSIGKLELSGKTPKNQRYHGFHIKTLKPKNKDTVASYEFLSNMGKGVTTKVTWRVSSKDDVVFLLNGERITVKKLDSKSKSQNQYEFTLSEGVIDIVKAKNYKPVAKPKKQ